MEDKKYGPTPLVESERRIVATLSVSNKKYPRLRRLRAAFLQKECHEASQAELEELIKLLSYRAIDAYCDLVERDGEAMIV